MTLKHLAAPIIIVERKKEKNAKNAPIIHLDSSQSSTLRCACKLRKERTTEWSSSEEEIIAR
jgi:hypothetical protein